MQALAVRTAGALVVLLAFLTGGRLTLASLVWPAYSQGNVVAAGIATAPSGGGPEPASTPVSTATATPTSTSTPTPTTTGTPIPPPPPSASGTVAISLAGGKLDLAGGANNPGGLTVEFPAGAIAGESLVTAHLRDQAYGELTPPAGTRVLQWTLEVVASPPMPLRKPVTLTIKPPSATVAAAGLDRLQLGLVRSGGQVELLATEPDPTTDTLRVTIVHLSRFVLLEAVRPGSTLTFPVNGARTPLGPLLTWSNLADATWAQVHVVPFNDDGPGIDLVVGDQPAVQAAQYQVAAPRFGSTNPNYVMLPDMTYTWAVRTAASSNTPTDADWTAWSQPRTFHTSAKSSATIGLDSPQDGRVVDSLVQTLAWSDSDSEIFYYEVQVSKDPNFGPDAFLYWELRHGGVTTPQNSYCIPEAFPLEAGTAYYWRVRPRVQGDGAPVEWSQVWAFRTGP